MEASLCGRVGCGEPLVAVLLMSPQDTHAWLVGPDHEFAIEGVGLCGAHADRITVPFGWTLVDERPATKPRKRRKKADDAVENAGPARKAKAKPKPKDSSPETVGRSTSHPAAQPAVGDELVSEPFPDDEYVPPEDEFRGDIDTEASAGADADAEAEADDDARRLSVVPQDDSAEGASELVDGEQETLWDEPDSTDTEPDDSTPLLQRAFRVVKDD